MEAGNRCFNMNSPEEVNRKIIDHCSDINMPYSKRSAHNLYNEGINQKSVFTIGNPITEVIDYFSGSINNSKILNKLKFSKKNYVLVTLHREENVDNKSILLKLCNNLEIIYI